MSTSETIKPSSPASINTRSASPPSPVTVPLRALAANSLPLSSLTSAFGPSSLGIILVSDLPPQYKALRSKLLQYASYLAHLPAEELERLTVPEAKYLTGWSHGKETLKSGKKDSFKGSWYSNCTFYHERHSAVHTGALGQGGGIDAIVARMAAEEAEREAEEEEEERLHAQDAANGHLHREGRRPSHVSPDYNDYPEYSAPNVWPSEDLLPGFRKTLEEMCSLIIDVAVLVARQCDRFAKETGIEGYQQGYLERVVSSSKTTKARLLHYFPPVKGGEDEGKVDAEAPEDAEDDDWCTTHKDHGCLTGLTSALFVDESDPIPTLNEPKPNADDSFDLPALNALKASPDPEAGLYIRSRTGELTKVAIPADCLAFQTGEALERVTKGKFAAVPHFVRGPRLGRAKGAENVARNTLAVFTQPNLGEAVDDKGTTFAHFAKEIVARNTVS